MMQTMQLQTVSIIYAGSSQLVVSFGRPSINYEFTMSVDTFHYMMNKRSTEPILTHSRSSYGAIRQR